MNKKKHCHFCGGPLTDKYVEGRTRKYCPGCREPIYENPVPATCIVVTDVSGGIWLVKRNVDPKKGFWCLPGGFMELDETPEQAALRELQEETGLLGKIDMLMGITINPSHNYGSVLMAGYLVREFSGEPFAGDDASDIACYGLDRLPEIAFDSHRHFIRIYQSAYK